MQIREVTNKEGFYSINNIWNTVLQKSDSNIIFSSFEWLSIWWDCFGHNKELFILLAQEGEEVIGIAPLMIEKRRILRYLPIKVVSFIGTGITDYADFIIVKDREKILTLFFEYLLKKKDYGIK